MMHNLIVQTPNLFCETSKQMPAKAVHNKSENSPNFKNGFGVLMVVALALNRGGLVVQPFRVPRQL